MKGLINLLLSIPQALFGGYIFAHMWSWFVVRKFGLPELTFMEAVGVLIVMGFPLFGLHVANILKEVKDDMRAKGKEINASTLGIITSLVTMLILYPMIFGCAYLWHLAIG